MFGSALYYPYVDVRDREWLRSAILFWDEIKTIVPSSIAEPYKSADTKICEQEGYLRPLRSELHAHLIEKLGRQVVRMLDNPGSLSSLYHQFSPQDPSLSALKHSEQIGHRVAAGFHQSGIYLEKISPELRGHLVELGLGRIHRGKVSRDLQELMDRDAMSPETQRALGIRSGYDGEWIVVDNRFASLYMAALAAMVAEEEALSPLTSKEEYQGLNLRCLIDDLAGGDIADAQGALVTLVMQGLRLDPDIGIEKLIAFRRARWEQLAELASTFQDLKSEIESSEDDRFETRVRRTFENKVRPNLEKLRKELSDQFLASTVTTFCSAAMFTGASGTLLANISTMNPTLISAIGLTVTVASVGVNATIASRKARRASPYSYLYDAHKKFGASHWA